MDEKKMKRLRSQISKAIEVLESTERQIRRYTQEGIMEYQDPREFFGHVAQVIDDLDEVDRRIAYLYDEPIDDIDPDSRTVDLGGNLQVGNAYMERGDADGIYYIWDNINNEEPDYYTSSLDGVKKYNLTLYMVWCRKYNIK